MERSDARLSAAHETLPGTSGMQPAVRPLQIGQLPMRAQEAQLNPTALPVTVSPALESWGVDKQARLISVLSVPSGTTLEWMLILAG